MAECALCGEELSKDPADRHCDSEEHIFPNAVGGRRTVSGFICRNCNSVTGDTWDAELARQIHPLCIIFGVLRDRGKTPPLKTVTTTGERITLRGQGRLSYTDPEFVKVERPDKSIEYSIRARSIDDARRILQNLKKKYPSLDVERSLSQAVKSESYLSGLLNFELQFGGPEGGRSIIKTCLAYACAKGIDWRDCHHAISYLRNLKAMPNFGYFYSRDLVSGRRADVPFHGVAVNADPKTGLIICYVEYFGIYKIIACLGENYCGPLIHKTYVFDPRNGEELSVEITLNFNQEKIEAIYNYEHYDSKAMEAAFSAVIGPALQADVDAERDRVSQKALEKAFIDCGAKPDEMLTEKHSLNISQSIAKSVTPFVLYRLRGMKPPDEW